MKSKGSYTEMVCIVPLLPSCCHALEVQEEGAMWKKNVQEKGGAGCEGWQ